MTPKLYPVSILRASDGDGLVCSAGGAPFPVRLLRIDAPEFDQPGGLHARRFLQDVAAGRGAILQDYGHDCYGRTLGIPSLPGLPDLCAHLVAHGWAWCYPPKLKASAYLRDLEAAARADRRGLWAFPNPRPPWIWRALHPRRQVIPKISTTPPATVRAVVPFRRPSDSSPKPKQE